MKKVFVIEGLGCAHCASKMEVAIKKIGGVKDASINFFTQKLTIEADDVLFDDIIQKASATRKRIEFSCKFIL